MQRNSGVRDRCIIEVMHPAEDSMSSPSYLCAQDLEIFGILFRKSPEEYLASHIPGMQDAGLLCWSEIRLDPHAIYGLVGRDIF
jgi:hypothetical protein